METVFNWQGMGRLYYDAIVSDSRWTLEIVKDGVRNGGVALNLEL